MSVQQQVKIKGIDVAVYLVKDVERAKRFWRDTMGCDVTAEWGDMGAEFTFPDGTTFGLFKPDDQEWRRGGGILFAVDDLDAAVAQYKARGVKLDDDGHIEDTPVCRMAFGEDSEGNYFILHQRKT